MPDVMTHILFAEKVKDRLNDTNVRHFINDYEKLFFLGAQGPDILFYYKPWNPYVSQIRESAETMHHTETAKFFKDAVVILNKSTGKDYEQFLVYILGFLCHYYSDKSLHPYVYSMIENGTYNFDGKRSKLSHYDIEALMDTRLWLREKGTPAYKENNAKIIDVKEFPDVIAEYISGYIYETQSYIIEEYTVKKAAKNMIKVLKILFDPKNKKKRFINIFPLPRKCYLEDNFPGVDILNENKREWHYPDDENNPIYLSVGEVLENAAVQCVKMVDAICGFLEKGHETDLNKLLPNEDYCTGRPL